MLARRLNFRKHGPARLLSNRFSHDFVESSAIIQSEAFAVCVEIKGPFMTFHRHQWIVVLPEEVLKLFVETLNAGSKDAERQCKKAEDSARSNAASILARAAHVERLGQSHVSTRDSHDLRTIRNDARDPYLQHQGLLWAGI